MDAPPPDFLDFLFWYEETPDLFDWAFWSKDSTSVRDLLVSLVAAVGIPFVIWREFSTHRAAKAAAEQVKIATRQAEIAAKRHEQQTKADRDRRITDSFAKAVELLGSDKLEGRLGAIYALERIARESMDDHWPIMETLTAYVLTRLPIHYRVQEVPGSNESQSSTNSADGAVKQKERIRDLPVDIQAVLTVLARRKAEYDAEGQLIDLSRADFSGVNLTRIKLSGVNLSAADLSFANLSFADLSKAKLIRANLRNADLSGANLAEANLDNADLSGANLARANLRNPFLSIPFLGKPFLVSARLCRTTMPDGTINNRDCPPELAPPNPSETPPAPN
jgi:hypothetical protein